MLKIIKLFWQQLIFPLAFIPYHILNLTVIVKWLGCGCPEISPNGEIIKKTFNANSFTAYFALLISAIVIFISVRKIKIMKDVKTKALYIFINVVLCLYLAYMFYILQQWN